MFNNVVHDIIETNDGRLFISSYDALDQYNYDSDDFNHYPINSDDSSSINQSYIISVFEDSRNNLWIGTNKGLGLYHEKEKFSLIFTTSQGLPGNIIKGITEDRHNNLWISTDKGLSKFINGTYLQKPSVFVNFTDLDGLAGNEFISRSVFQDKSGIMYFGTSQGYTYFHPDSIFLNTTPPKVIFSEMQILLPFADKNSDTKRIISNVNTLDKLKLTYHKSDFLIKFAALNYLSLIHI